MLPRHVQLVKNTFRLNSKNTSTIISRTLSTLRAHNFADIYFRGFFLQKTAKINYREIFFSQIRENKFREIKFLRIFPKVL